MYDEEYLGDIQVVEGPYTGISSRMTYNHQRVRFNFLIRHSKRDVIVVSESLESNTVAYSENMLRIREIVFKMQGGQE